MSEASGASNRCPGGSRTGGAARNAAITLLLAVAAGGGCAHGASPVTHERGVRIGGAEVRVERRSGPELRGELLAVDGENLWVLGPEGAAREVPFAVVRRTRVVRHHRGVAGWALAAGGLTSLGMALACASYEGSSSCAGQVALFAFTWGGVGGVAALLVGAGRYTEFSGVDELRPYARFPQGLPQGYDPGGG